MTTFCIQSFGCRVNQAEAFDWVEALQARGLKMEKNYLRSELIIVNSCALTAGAERDVRKFLRRLSRLNPQARLVMTGCGVPLLRDELKKNPQVELIISNEEKAELLSRLEKWGHKPKETWVLKDQLRLENEIERDLTLEDEVISPEDEIEIEGKIVPKDDLAAEETIIEKDSGKTQIGGFRSRGLIKIQDGCSQACTFCLIPQVRGPSRSRPAREILERMKQLIRQGYREIVLVGIHLTSYGEAKDSSDSLLELLQQATELENLGRIRLSSLDPRAMKDELIDFMAGHDKICQHFHLSLQHASLRLLRLMGRKGDPEDYLRILNRLRAKSAFASLGADIIVGFPGETEEDYDFLENFITRSPLTYLHVFPYSARPGTPASRWPQLEARIKKERASRLRWLGRKKNFVFRQSLVGLVFEGLAICAKNEAESEVLTHNYLKVRVEGKLRGGEEVVVKIEEVKPEITTGTLLQWGK